MKKKLAVLEENPVKLDVVNPYNFLLYYIMATRRHRRHRRRSRKMVKWGGTKNENNEGANEIVNEGANELGMTQIGQKSIYNSGDNEELLASVQNASRMGSNAPAANAVVPSGSPAANAVVPSGSQAANAKANEEANEEAKEATNPAGGSRRRRRSRKMKKTKKRVRRRRN